MPVRARTPQSAEEGVHDVRPEATTVRDAHQEEVAVSELHLLTRPPHQMRLAGKLTDDAAICAECIALCREILSEQLADPTRDDPASFGK